MGCRAGITEKPANFSVTLDRAGGPSLARPKQVPRRAVHRVGPKNFQEASGGKVSCDILSGDNVSGDHLSGE